LIDKDLQIGESMTVAELIQKLSTLPQDMKVVTPYNYSHDVAEGLNDMADVIIGVEVKTYYKVLSSSRGSNISFIDLYAENPDASSTTTSQTPTQLAVIE
jgi:hypothetical protein